MTIPPPFLDLVMECGECELRSTPDLIMGHLVEAHGYNVGQSENVIEYWIEETDKQACPEHGCIGLECPGCGAYEAREQGWKEARHERTRH